MEKNVEILLVLPKSMAEAATREARKGARSRNGWIRSLISIATQVPDTTRVYKPRKAT